MIVVENDRGEEEALMELGPPVAVTGLMVKFVVLMMVMMMVMMMRFLWVSRTRPLLQPFPRAPP